MGFLNNILSGGRKSLTFEADSKPAKLVPLPK